MSTLRLGWAVATAAVLAVAGCGDDDGGDAGTGGSDSGGVDAGATDSGPRPDAGEGVPGMCPAGECDLLTNSGCTAPEACQYLLPSMGAPEPAPVCVEAGTGGDGDSCTDYTDCQEGFACDRDAGVCRHYCCGNSDAACPTGQTCAVSLGPGGVGFCRLPDTCDPLAQTGCPEGQGCYITGTDGSVICIASTMNLGEGDTCSAANDCEPGLVCASGGGDSSCRAWCDATAEPDPCPEGRTCTSFGVSSHPEWGACLLAE